MKKNILTVLFCQIIAARSVPVKNEAGDVTGVKEIPARKVEVEFKHETEKEINAKWLAQWFLTKLVPFQKLQVLNGTNSFQTSKPMSVTIKVNQKTFSDQMKFTVNPDRLLKCLERSQSLVALLVQMQNAPAYGSADKVITNYLLNAPQDVIIAKAKKIKELSPVIETVVDEVTA